MADVFGALISSFFGSVFSVLRLAFNVVLFGIAYFFIYDKIARDDIKTNKNRERIHNSSLVMESGSRFYDSTKPMAFGKVGKGGKMKFLDKRVKVICDELRRLEECE